MEEIMNKTIRIMVLGLLGLTMVPVQAFDGIWALEKSVWALLSAAGVGLTSMFGRNYRNQGWRGYLAGAAFSGVVTAGCIYRLLFDNKKQLKSNIEVQTVDIPLNEPSQLNVSRSDGDGLEGQGEDGIIPGGENDGCDADQQDKSDVDVQTFDISSKKPSELNVSQAYAGVLPLVEYQGGYYIILGRENDGDDKDTYDAFGGVVEGDQTVGDAATKEFIEETANCLEDFNEQETEQTHLYIDNMVHSHVVEYRTNVGNHPILGVIYVTRFKRDIIDDLKKDFERCYQCAKNRNYQEKDVIVLVKLTDFKRAVDEYKAYSNRNPTVSAQVIANVSDSTLSEKITIPIRSTLAATFCNKIDVARLEELLCSHQQNRRLQWHKLILNGSEYVHICSFNNKEYIRKSAAVGSVQSYSYYLYEDFGRKITPCDMYGNELAEPRWYTEGENHE
jgi:hypothetical protein